MISYFALLLSVLNNILNKDANTSKIIEFFKENYNEDSFTDTLIEGKLNYQDLIFPNVFNLGFISQLVEIIFKVHKLTLAHRISSSLIKDERPYILDGFNLGLFALPGLSNLKYPNDCHETQYTLELFTLFKKEIVNKKPKLTFVLTILEREIISLNLPLDKETGKIVMEYL